jgi:hypothetical protein
MDEAKSLIKAEPTPIVVCERESNDGNWRCALKEPERVVGTTLRFAGVAGC